MDEINQLEYQLQLYDEGDDVLYPWFASSLTQAHPSDCSSQSTVSR